MIFPLLDYVDRCIVAGTIPYSRPDVFQARLDLAKPTKMIDYAMEMYREVHGVDAIIPPEMEEKKAAVFKELDELRDGQMKLTELMSNVELRVSWIRAQVFNIYLSIIEY
jgi:translation initiation factor 3 subunit E